MDRETVYILGAGAVGFPLAVYLARAGRPVVAVRTSRPDVARQPVTVTVDEGERRVSAEVEMVSLARLEAPAGMLVVTAKAYANEAIARELKEKAPAGQPAMATGPVVVMQNGVGVEEPFLAAGFSPVYRCVLYMTSQAAGDDDDGNAGIAGNGSIAYRFRPVTASPIGVAAGDGGELAACVGTLSTAAFPFRAEEKIEREVWKKAIVNTVFNSICPLLEVDNGTFARDEGSAELAREVVGECVRLTERLGIDLGEEEVMAQILRISEASAGQLISTLQDIRAGRPTEIDFLNVAIARTASSLQPPLALARTAFLGKMIAAKSRVMS